MGWLRWRKGGSPSRHHRMMVQATPRAIRARNAAALDACFQLRGRRRRDQPLPAIPAQYIPTGWQASWQAALVQ